jgi:hypothetical protein
VNPCTWTEHNAGAATDTVYVWYLCCCAEVMCQQLADVMSALVAAAVPATPTGRMSVATAATPATAAPSSAAGNCRPPPALQQQAALAQACKEVCLLLSVLSELMGKVRCGHADLDDLSCTTITQLVSSPVTCVICLNDRSVAGHNTRRRNTCTHQFSVASAAGCTCTIMPIVLRATCSSVQHVSSHMSTTAAGHSAMS